MVELALVVELETRVALVFDPRLIEEVEFVMLVELEEGTTPIDELEAIDETFVEAVPIIDVEFDVDVMLVHGTAAWVA